MATTKVRTKTTSTKPSTSPNEVKTVSAVESVAEEVPSKVAVAETPEAKKSKKYEATELIQVRSITQGELILLGKKSGTLYRWSGFGDISEVEYQDLYSLKAVKSRFLYDPLFIIEDEEMLEDARWKDLKDVYDKMYNEDLDSVLNLPANQLERVLSQMPKGFQQAVRVEVASRIDAGTFDSVNKIKAVDRVCGSDLMLLIS